MAASQEFEIESAILDADREFNLGGDLGTYTEMTQPIDIRAMIGEINIFEDIQKGYVTATVGVLDDMGLLTEIVELQGTETLKLTIGCPDKSSNARAIEILFKIVSIVNQAKQSDRVSVFVLNCISPYAYSDAASKISKSYTGQLEDISERILNDHLDVEVERKEKFWDEDMKSIQGRVKILTPYISPLESVEWLMERAMGQDGGPFFAWSTAWQWEEGTQKKHFGALKTMLREGITNAKSNKEYQFRYSISTIPTTTKYSENAHSIISFTNGGSIENTLSMMNQGTVGSWISNLDTYTTQKMNRHFNLDEYRNMLTKSVGAGTDLLTTVLDEEATVFVDGEETPTVEANGRSRSLVTSYGTYEWENSYHDVFDQTQLVNKIRKSAALSMLYKNVLEVAINGFSFMENEITTGDVIKIIFDSQMSDDITGKKRIIDERTSGYYLIIGLRHSFQLATHRVYLSLAKVADNF